jgi:SNF2 family DNA or RNA helicase
LELTEKYLELNRSVVIFVNFIETQQQIIKQLLENNIPYSTIDGSQSAEEKEKNRKQFQEDKTRVIVTMIQAGGQSISLHDTVGKYPRVSLISPSFSSTELIQALGRIYRADTKTPVLQRILFCSNTSEELVCERIRKKLKFLSTLSDEDMIKF